MSDLSFSTPRTASSRSWWKWLLAILAALGAVAVLAALIENHRGKRAWERFRTEAEARGERFDLEAVAPAPVPYDDNFATTPLLADLLNYFRAPNQPVQWVNPEGRKRALALSSPFKGKKKTPQPGQWPSGVFIRLEEWQAYFDGNTNFSLTNLTDNAARDVLTALKVFDEELSELTQASQRPHSVFPVRYKETFNALLPHLSVIKGATQLARLRALARLGSGDTGGALQDVKLCLRLAESTASELFLISQLVRISNLQSAMQPVWEGLCRHAWTEAQLAELQSSLESIRVLESYGPSMRGERTLGNAMIDHTRRGRLRLDDMLDGDMVQSTSTATHLVPDGWFYQNQVTYNRLIQDHCLPLVDTAQHRVFVDAARAAEEAPELKSASLYNIFARLLFPGVLKAAMKFAAAQTAIDQATVACALERYRLAEGKYPDTLDPLVPKFIARIPVDVINGELPRYRRESDGTFVLYSIGWNQKDEGGDVASRKPTTSVDAAIGDWVWKQVE